MRRIALALSVLLAMAGTAPAGVAVAVDQGVAVAGVAGAGGTGGINYLLSQAAGDGGNVLPPDRVSASPKQLQKKFDKHAADFGVTGTRNKANLKAFETAVQDHVQNPAVQHIAGSYRGDPVIIHVDPKTGLAVIANTAGEFISGWKLSAQQLWHVLNGARLGGG